MNCCICKQRSKHKLIGTVYVADGAVNTLDSFHGMAASGWEKRDCFLTSKQWLLMRLTHLEAFQTAAWCQKWNAIALGSPLPGRRHWKSPAQRGWFCGKTWEGVNLPPFLPWMLHHRKTLVRLHSAPTFSFTVSPPNFIQILIEVMYRLVQNGDWH